ncbi:hypothetical protein [Parasitella parasitica]|uniref:F-box domain-containing protein n=1 Tax=Parasitella parasitica TaxID=35722 RepID=A0A0B7NSI2_9FUNG|nr:hypothetical protein [Parasitella parasitica]
MAQTTNLPTEILIQIVNYLTPQEKQSGLFICQDWYHVFRYSLYHSISIRTICQLELFLQSLIESSANAMPNGYLIKNLFIQRKTVACLEKMTQERLIIPRFLFEQLPDLCPNLEVLDFDPETWKFVCFHSNVSKWTHMRRLPKLSNLGANLPFLRDLGQGLESLSIQSSMIVDISTQGRLVSILSLAPNICSLEIKGDKESTLNLTLSDIETIHQLSLHLIRLEIVGDNIRLVPMEDDQETIKKISGFPTTPQLISLRIDARMTPVTWLRYVSHKYPRLKYLSMDVHYDTSNPMENFQTEKDLFLDLVRKCRHIEVLELSCPVLTHWLNGSLFELLKANRCIQEIKPIPQRCSQIKRDADFSLAINLGRHFLTALEIEQWRMDTKLPLTVQKLSNFTKLRYLGLKCDSYHEEYQLDLLLASCPVLETLSIEWGSLIAPDKKPATNRRRHPLTALRMTFASFSMNVFEYLSASCPYISAISMTKCKQLCIINNVPSQTVVELNLPNHHLDSLVLNGVRLDYSNASMFYHGFSSYIRIASLTTSQRNVWQHHIGYKANDRKFPIIAPLDQNDALNIQSYFDQRESSHTVHSSKQFLKNISAQKVNNMLKANLMFGYIRVCCKSIDEFYLDGNVNCQV